MKFYLWTLSIYSVIATVLIVLLALQNRALKRPVPTVAKVNYSDVHQVPVGDAPIKGAANAPITIVMFSEFECPACGRAVEIVDQILTKYEGRVRLAHKDYPLRMHRNARAAAAAARAAGMQDRYWDMHQMLFAATTLGDETYRNAAQQLGLDLDRFEQERDLKLHESAIDQDAALGKQLNVQGTPTFFVNGVRVQSYRLLEDTVQHFLNKTGGG